MFDFGAYIDLPFIWAGIIGFAIFVYIVLDGFDLGTGILFPFAPSDECRSKMIMSIAPFWDGNETWLILGGGGLFAAFPYAYSIAMPGFYIPLLIMLLALVFRGVSFEFMFKATGKMKKFWGYSFHFGSMAAAFCQGIILGGFIDGISMNNGKIAEVPYQWLTTFSLFCGFAITFSYALIGSTWLIMKTSGRTHDWAKKVTAYVGIYVFIFTGAISLFSPFINHHIYNRWFTPENLILIGWLPFFVVFGFIYLYKTLYSLTDQNDHMPFFITIGIFTLCCLGLAFSVWPYIVPYHVTIWQGAASTRSLSLLLVGAVLVMPMILLYTAYTYYIFRGKIEPGHY